MRRRITRIVAGFVTVLVLAGIILYAGATLSNTISQVNGVSKGDDQLRAQIDQLQEEIAAMRYALDNREDPAVIEDIARDKLGLVMPDERIYFDSGE